MQLTSSTDVCLSKMCIRDRGDVDDQGNKTDTRTILAAVGSEIAADDQIIDIEGYEYSKDLTTEKNGGESVTVAAEPLARSSVSGMTLSLIHI